MAVTGWVWLAGDAMCGPNGTHNVDDCANRVFAIGQLCDDHGSRPGRHGQRYFIEK
jgi:hypothetical protein